MVAKLVLVEHDPAWKNMYSREAQQIKNLLSDELLEIYHIGSTAVPGLIAKPIVDILCVVKDLEALDALQKAVVVHGYEWKGEYGIPGRRFITKPNPNRSNDQLDNIAHIHCFAQNSLHIQRHLDFRNYLIKHPECVQRYADLKKKLFMRGVDRDSYQAQKADFIKMVEQAALEDEQVLRKK
jgi:GrpB-like predicted nucleotidyltransferase (UPF0157 family)